MTESRLLVRRLLLFALRVARNFFRNKGLLLAGSLAYNALLSLVPLLGLVVVAQSYLFDAQTVLLVIQGQLEHITGAQYVSALTVELGRVVEYRDVIGVVGVGVLVFFSAIAFRILEDAFALIFSHGTRRSAWVSLAIAYAFAGVVVLALILLTWFVQFFGVSHPGSGTAWLPFALGVVGEIILFAAVYRVVPVAPVSFRRALIGGVVAALLWELCRAALTAYFSSISLVGVVYGSLATVVVVLLSLEVASIIVLVGAQVIAELEHSDAASVPWHVEGQLDSAHAGA